MHLQQENLTFLLTIWKLILTIYIELRVVIYLRRKRSEWRSWFILQIFKSIFGGKVSSCSCFKILSGSWYLIASESKEDGEVTLQTKRICRVIDRHQGEQVIIYHWKRRKNLKDAEVEKCTGIEKSFKLGGIKSPNFYQNLLMSIFLHMMQGLNDLKKLLFLQI